MNIRKRIQFYNGFLALILNNSQGLTDKEFLIILEAFSIDSLKWVTVDRPLDELLTSPKEFENSTQFQ